MERRPLNDITEKPNTEIKNQLTKDQRVRMQKNKAEAQEKLRKKVRGFLYEKL
jgi:hypothetical protein